MPTVLDRIVANKREEIAYAKLRRDLQSLKDGAMHGPEVRDFLQALRGHDYVRLIAEVKRASPSKGMIRPVFDHVEIALAYEAGGAAAISVLTDEPFFQGRLDYLTSIRDKVAIPVLRKDFILDEYQVYEARVAGADAVLLIAECLEGEELKFLYDLVHGLGMCALIELYEGLMEKEPSKRPQTALEVANAFHRIYPEYDSQPNIQSPMSLRNSSGIAPRNSIVW